MYVVDRDFGFAPNPFHNLCTLATCKPITRRVAKEADWIIGMGGSRLNATGRCIFAMRVSQTITFDEYWTNPLYRDKKPVRNGSKKMMVGDNIYHLVAGNWQQLNSHHSYPDGSPNPDNVKNDTQTNAVLVSEYFFYFGAAAIEIPTDILRKMNYKNGRSHRTYDLADAQPLILYIEANFTPNKLLGDPFDFEAASSRYSAGDNKVTVDG
jgi:Nucleotide modification associated domain 2